MIIAFDTSPRRTGWVRGLPDGPVEVGSFGVEGATRKLGLLQHLFALQAWPLIEGCSHVYFEAPIVPRHGNVSSIRPLWALTAHVEFLAHHAGASCAEVDNQSHKQVIYGHGGAKPENAEEYAHAWGLPARNNDEADACGVFLYALKTEFPAAFKGWLSIRGENGLVTRIAPPKKPGNKSAKITRGWRATRG